MVWYGTVRYGMVWYGMVWYGMVWYGMVWYGLHTVGDGRRGNGGCLGPTSTHNRTGRTIMRFDLAKASGGSAGLVWMWSKCEYMDTQCTYHTYSSTGHPCMMDITTDRNTGAAWISHVWEKLCCALPSRCFKMLQHKRAGNSHFPATLSLPSLFTVRYSQARTGTPFNGTRPVLCALCSVPL